MATPEGLFTKAPLLPGAWTAPPSVIKHYSTERYLDFKSTVPVALARQQEGSGDDVKTRWLPLMLKVPELCP